MRKPSKVPYYEKQYELFEIFSKRVIEDMEQMSIVVNYLEDQIVRVTPKERVKFTTVNNKTFILYRSVYKDHVIQFF